MSTVYIVSMSEEFLVVVLDTKVIDNGRRDCFRITWRESRCDWHLFIIWELCGTVDSNDPCTVKIPFDTP